MSGARVPPDVFIFKGSPQRYILGAGVTAEEAGESMLAALGTCSHPNVVPVEAVVTGEIVAGLCPDCDRQLPASWGQRAADRVAEATELEKMRHCHCGRRWRYFGPNPGGPVSEATTRQCPIGHHEVKRGGIWVDFFTGAADPKTVLSAGHDCGKVDIVTLPSGSSFCGGCGAHDW